MKKILLIVCAAVVFVVALVISYYFANVIHVERRTPKESAPASTQFLTLPDGEIIAYSEIDHHSSTTVLFIGGLSAWNGTWERSVLALDALRGDLNYIALDLPPFGYSGPDREKNFFRDTQANRIADFIEEKKIGRVIIVGHSYGAGPATEYAMREGSRAVRLIVIDGVLNVDEPKVIPRYSPVQLALLRTVLLGALIHNDAFAISRLKSFVVHTEHIDQALLDIYTRYFDTDDTTGRLSRWFVDYVNDPLGYLSNSSVNYRRLAIPVRLIWGEQDTVTPIDGADVVLSSAPDVGIIRLAGVGHIPMIEDYAQFDAALLSSLSN